MAHPAYCAWKPSPKLRSERLWCTYERNPSSSSSFLHLLYDRMGCHHAEYLSKKMKEENEKALVSDTVYQLQQFLSDISTMEMTEMHIAKELEDIKINFGDEGEGFYGGMIFDSVGRAQKLLKYRSRIQGLVDRLTTFMKGRPRKYQVIEGGLVQYD